MTHSQPNTIIGRRTLDALDAAGEPHLVTVTLMVPEQVADEEWACTVKIAVDAAESSPIMHIRGVDGLQAVFLALKIVAATLEGYERLDGWTLTWHGERDLGFGTF